MGTEPLRQSALSMAIGAPCALAMTSILDFVSACSLACDQTFRAHALALTPPGRIYTESFQARFAKDFFTSRFTLRRVWRRLEWRCCGALSICPSSDGSRRRRSTFNSSQNTIARRGRQQRTQGLQGKLEEH